MTAAEMLNAAQKWIFDRTVSIYFRTKDGIPRTFGGGSGVLLQIAERHYVVSAHHVLKAVRDEDIILIGMHGQHVLEVARAHAALSSNEHLYDVAFIELTAQDAAVVGARKKFVVLSEVDREDLALQPARYMLLGTPIQLTQMDSQTKRISSFPISFTTTPYKGDRELIKDFTPGVSIALAYDPERIMRPDDSKLPHFSGLSGCGIWRLYFAGDEPPWSVDMIRLVGIDHDVGRSHIRGTSIGVALCVIEEAWPELGACLRIVHPERPRLLRADADHGQLRMSRVQLFDHAEAEGRPR